MSPFIVECSVSKMVHYLCAVLHISTIFMVLFYLDKFYWWIILPLLLSELYCHYQYSCHNPNRISRIEIRSNLQAVIVVQKKNITVELAHNSFYSKYIMLLLWRCLETNKIYRQAIFPDMCHANLRRRLKVYCNIHNGKI